MVLQYCIAREKLYKISFSRLFKKRSWKSIFFCTLKQLEDYLNNENSPFPLLYDKHFMYLKIYEYTQKNPYTAFETTHRNAEGH